MLFTVPVEDLMRLLLQHGFIHCTSENECRAYEHLFEKVGPVRAAYEDLVREFWHEEQGAEPLRKEAP